MSQHGYVDESDRGRRGYLMCMSMVDPSAIGSLRSNMRALLLPGMPRFHMRNESDRLRKAMLSELAKAEVAAALYVARHRVRREGRAEILRHIVANERINRLVLESRGVQDREDTQVLYDAVRKEGLELDLSYAHLRAESEPLLWIPDAIAWAHGKGGEWRRRAMPLISNVVELEGP